MIEFLFNLIKILERLFGKEMKAVAKEDAPEWYKIAIKELGVKEIDGSGNNKRILEYHSTTSLQAEEDSVPWCSAFVNWCFLQAGIKGTNSAMARSWLKWGQEVKEPYLGCVVVFARGVYPQGHVGFFVAEDNGMIGCLAGNQGDAVSVAYYSKSKVLGFREPKKD